MRRKLESIQRDARFLRIAEVRRADRVRLTFHKYAMRARPALRLPLKPIAFAGRPYHVSAPGDAALLQQVILDAHDYLRLFELTGQPGLVMIDVGAHNGETTLAWSLLLEDPVVYAFEPDPVAYRNAVRNVGALTRALHPVGLSDHAGEAALDARGSGGDATFVATGRPRDAATTVPIARGDNILGTLAADLVKIDVEGYERHVVDGLTETLGRCRFLNIEMSLARRKDHGFHEIAAVLAAHRFELIAVGRAHARRTAVDLYFRRIARVDETPGGPSPS